MISVEILQFPSSRKYRDGKVPNLPARLFSHLADCASSHGVRVCFTKPESFRGNCDWLMLYGPGGLDRIPLMQRQRARGGYVVCWDAPYWQRGDKLRVSINHAHPQLWVMQGHRAATRLLNDFPGFDHMPLIANDPMDHRDVLIAGIGTKAAQQYGAHVVRAWENQMVVAARLLWGDRRRIVYRAKPHYPSPPPTGALLVTSEIPIERAFRDTAVVVTWHSNVAVDAIRIGLPVCCHDGAAAAVCPATLSYDMASLRYAVRRQFLANLAWFQWRPDEAPHVWAFLTDLLIPFEAEMRPVVSRVAT